MSIIIHLSLQYGRSSLMDTCTCRKDNAEVVQIVQKLLSKGADVNAQDKVSSTSPAQ